MKRKAAIGIFVALILLLSSAFYGSLFTIREAYAATSGLVGYWSLDEGAGYVAYDASGYGNDGILSGGRFGNALEFDGVDDYVMVPDSSSLRVPSTELTIEAWICFPSSSTWSYQLMIRKWKDADGGWPSYILGKTQDNRIYGAVTNKELVQQPTWTTTQTIANLSIEDTWAHIVFTWKKENITGADGSMYVNGVSVNTTFNPGSYSDAFTISYADYPLYFARKAEALTFPSSYFRGKMDEIRISNIARTSFNLTTPPALDANTVALWHFDEGTGPIMYDASPNANNGTISGALWTGNPPAWVDGKYGKALHFDGAMGYVEVAHSDALNNPNFTIEAWIFLDADVAATQWGIVSKQETLQKTYSFDVFGKGYNGSSGNQLVLSIGDGATWVNLMSDTNLSNNTWYHVAGTHEGNTSKIYINGVLDKNGTTLTQTVSNTGVLTIGCQHQTGFEPRFFFNGTIDDVKIYNRALSESEIQADMLQDFTPPTIGTPSRIPDGDVSPDQPVKVSVNVTDYISGVKNVTLSYTTNDGASWTDLPMNFNSSTNLYEEIIPGQDAGTLVRFKIVAYDHVENKIILDGAEPYCVYQVVPEFPPSLILPIFMIITLFAAIVYKRKHPPI